MYWKKPIPMKFESSVNSEGIETFDYLFESKNWFESSVNSEGIETLFPPKLQGFKFESSVNSEGIETFYAIQVIRFGV